MRLPYIERLLQVARMSLKEWNDFDSRRLRRVIRVRPLVWVHLPAVTQPESDLVFGLSLYRNLSFEDCSSTNRGILYTSRDKYQIHTSPIADKPAPITPCPRSFCQLRSLRPGDLGPHRILQEPS